MSELDEFSKEAADMFGEELAELKSFITQFDSLVGDDLMTFISATQTLGMAALNIMRRELSDEWPGNAFGYSLIADRCLRSKEWADLETEKKGKEAAK